MPRKFATGFGDKELTVTKRVSGAPQLKWATNTTVTMRTLLWRRFDMNKNLFKARLARLGKKQVDVIRELGRRGVNVTQVQFAKFMRSQTGTDRCNLVLDTAERIVSDWEAGR